MSDKKENQKDTNVLCEWCGKRPHNGYQSKRNIDYPSSKICDQCLNEAIERIRQGNFKLQDLEE
ncbi:hypothetical protein LCGC14_1366320 [marine sediment metagenome]|uniref:ClpX-type ZB domain-containing protein n=1 Tax=marine sediment metagenome TaxID=412755 RepID=A0A0F9K787_9ZZZZ